jgi:hypothetical protein
MSALDRWFEHLQDRDAICAAILDLASAVKAHSVANQLAQLDVDVDDQAIDYARAQLALLIEDPALASAITHAIRRLLKRWEEEHHAVMTTTSSPLRVSRSFAQRLRGRLLHKKGIVKGRPHAAR